MLAALIIVFREAVEAGLIVGIVLAATRGLPHRGRWVAGGVAGGLAGAALVAAFASQIADALLGAGQEILNAAVLLVAVTMLAWHNAWMAAHGRDLARRMTYLGGEVAAGRRPLTALAVVVGAAVLREGAEVVLFLTGVAAAGSPAPAMALGGLLGVVAAALLSAGLYLGLVAIPAHLLFGATTGFITLLAAGLAAQAVTFLEQAGIITESGAPLWDSSWLLADGSLGGRLLHTLIGYTAAPTGLQLAAYLATITAILGLMRLARRPQEA